MIFSKYNFIKGLKNIIAFFLIFVAVLIIVPIAIAQNKYEISADLVKVKRDRVRVMVKTPKISESTISWIMPAVIPGSYSRKDFGRFIVNFKAFDDKGKRLKVVKEGMNVFTISDATILNRIEYDVKDS